MDSIYWTSVARVCITVLRASTAHPAANVSATDILMEIAQKLDDMEKGAK